MQRFSKEVLLFHLENCSSESKVVMTFIVCSKQNVKTTFLNLDSKHMLDILTYITQTNIL